MAIGVIDTAANATASLAGLVPDQFAGLVQSITGLLQVLVGGVFGLIAISILFRLWESMKMARLLKELNSNIAELNKHLKRADRQFHVTEVKKKK